jgi:hypothetical protein
MFFKIEAITVIPALFLAIVAVYLKPLFAHFDRSKLEKAVINLCGKFLFWRSSNGNPLGI